jgi:hypothetical protein
VPPNPFEYQAPDESQVSLLISFRGDMRLLYEKLLKELPDSRYRSVAITKLEEVSMWTNKAIAFMKE